MEGFLPSICKKISYLAVEEAIKDRDEEALERRKKMRRIRPQGKFLNVVQWSFYHE